MTWIGSVVLVLGLGGLGWAAYDLFWVPPVDPAVSAQQRETLRQAWRDQAGVTASQAAPGDAIALLRIPTFGDFEQAVLVGTDDAVLRQGLGWYAGTAEPGAVGNFAVAGLRGARGPLAQLVDLKAGDEVVVETAAAIYTYEISNVPAETTVQNTDTWVLQPVPGHPELRATEARITLTTSRDLFDTDRRTIAFGTLVQTTPK